jgi:hypothetical protein
MQASGHSHRSSKVLGLTIQPADSQKIMLGSSKCTCIPAAPPIHQSQRCNSQYSQHTHQRSCWGPQTPRPGLQRRACRTLRAAPGCSAPGRPLPAAGSAAWPQGCQGSCLQQINMQLIVTRLLVSVHVCSVAHALVVTALQEQGCWGSCLQAAHMH